MPTQADIAEHLDMSVPAVSQLMRGLSIDWRTAALDDIRIIYIRRLRAEAAGRSGEDQVQLTRARAREASASADLKQQELAQRMQVLVPAEDVEAELSAAFAAVRSEILGLEERLADIVESETGARLDPELVRSVTRTALANLASRADDPAPGGAEELAGLSAAV